MATIVSTLGNGSGYIYVTKQDGTSIISNIINDKKGAQAVMALVQSQTYAPSASTQNAEAFKVYLNASGSEGDLTGAKEITRDLVTQQKIVTVESNIVSDTVYFTREGHITVVELVGEGDASDEVGQIVAKDYDKVSGANNHYVENDIIILRKATGANGTMTIKSTGNIKLDSDASFIITDEDRDTIALQYVENAWTELFRSPNAGYSVTKMRAADVPMDILGVEKITYTGSQTGLASITSGTDENVIVVTSSGSQTATTNFTIPSPSGTPITGERFICYFNATVVKGSYTFTIFGKQLTTEELASGAVMVETVYDGASWNTVKTSSVTGSNSVVTSMITDGAITEDKIADKAITSDKLASGAQGGIIISSYVASSTATTGSDVTLVSLEVEANTLSATNAEVLRVIVFGTLASGSGSNTIKVNFGSQEVYSETTTKASNRFKIVCDIFRTGSNTQKSIGHMHFQTDTGDLDIQTGLTVTETSSNDLDVIVNQADASQYVVEGVIVEAVASF